MALTDDELDLLDQAICDGLFSPRPAGAPPGTIIRITPDILKTAYRNTSDDDIRNMLRGYVANKVTTLTAQKTKITDDLRTVQENVDALQAVAIAPPVKGATLSDAPVEEAPIA